MAVSLAEAATPLKALLMNNLRGIILMVLAMAGFAVEDAFIKTLAANGADLGAGMSVGQILVLLAIGGTAIYALWAIKDGISLFSKDFVHPAVLTRNGTEMLGTWGFVTGIATIPLATVTTVLQAAPLLVTMGAALIFKETVGWRRWAAIAVGFTGMLLVVRPGFGTFDPNVLWAVLGVLGLSARDLATRRIPKTIPTLQLSSWGFVSVGLLGAILVAAGGSWIMPTIKQWLLLSGAISVGAFAYWAITEATRVGEISAVAPFRYSRLIFALTIGTLIFKEVPDGLTLAGAALIMGSGIYAFYRERVRKQQAALNA
jgi:drug/metabolite transporter (DMT)-like permease